MFGSKVLEEVTIRRSILALLALVLAGCFLVVWSGPADAATTFTVNKTSDVADRKITDAVCDTSRKRGKQCTLRAAIQEANDTSGADTINFKIGGTTPVKTINVSSSGLGPLPEIRDNVTINGYSQPGASPNALATGNNAVLKIELNGSNVRGDGLMIVSGQNTIKGLVINGVHGDGIEISGIEAPANTVQGNFIGTNANGTEAAGNWNGVKIDGSSFNAIGGTEPAQRNVISGNEMNGVHFTKEGDSIGSAFPSDNTVEGNFIGTNASGSQALGNGFRGVYISNATSTTVGGTTTEAANVIANNGDDGVTISNGTGNSVLSNRMFRNVGLGIDLGASDVTANDTDDPDTGANNLQNFPVITLATRSNTTGLTTISGTLNSNPNQTFIIQCFLADGAAATSNGEGFTWAGSTTITTNDGGDSPPLTCASNAPTVGGTVSATATNTATGDTSEFSQNVAVTSST